MQWEAGDSSRAVVRLVCLSSCIWERWVCWWQELQKVVWLCLCFPVVPHFAWDFSHFSFKVLTPIQSFLFFHRNIQSLFSSKVRNIDTVAIGRAVYTDKRNLHDLEVNYFYVPNFGPLLWCLAHLGLAGQKLCTLTMLPCGITSQVKFHGNEEMSFPYLQLCALFKHVMDAKWTAACICYVEAFWVWFTCLKKFFWAQQDIALLLVVS